MRPLTKADKERGVKIQDLGCIVCAEFNGCFTPCAIHHISGQAKKGCHDLTIGLCDKHHQIKSNDKPPIWISRHGDNRNAFEKEYHTEDYLLQLTNGLIGEGND